MGFQSVHIFAAKWTCSVVGTGGISHGKSSTILAVYQFVSKAVVSGPWRRANPLSSPRWVCATEVMVVLVYAVFCMYMESDPKPKKSGTATSTATPITK